MQNVCFNRLYSQSVNTVECASHSTSTIMPLYESDKQHIVHITGSEGGMCGQLRIKKNISYAEH